MANSYPEHTVTPFDQQEAIALVSQLPDGSLVITPKAIGMFFPTMAQACASPAPKAAPALQKSNVEQLPVKPVSTGEDYQRKLNFYRGRVWASMKRRFMREEGITEYQAYQDIAAIECKPVTEIQMYVKFVNRITKKRVKSLRQSIVWKMHCLGLKHKEIADRFPFDLHYKTVASDIKEMKSRQNGGTQNVR